MFLTRNRGVSQNVEMPVADQVGKELKEKRHREQADVHAVDVRVGCENDFVVAESLDAFFDSEGVPGAG